jgi:RNA polymerase sigma-70 factor, ECF subfamily
MAEQLDFANSVAQHVPSLTRMVRRLMRGDEITEDVVQDTVLKALIHADQFRFESTLKTWLGSIAMNEVHQVYRSKWQRCTVPLAAKALGVRDYHPVVFPRDYEAEERDLLVRRAVSRLPLSYRSLVELCVFQQLSLNKAAAELGLTLPAVKTRLYRARKKLRHLIATAGAGV